MKRLIAFSLSVLAAVTSFAAASLEFQSDSGKFVLSARQSCVVLPDQPTVQEKTAAEELIDHLTKITGETLEVVAEKDFKKKQGFFIGNTARAKKVGIDVASLGEESIRLKSDGPSLILAGGKRGAIYATLTFLEDYLGVRWFAADCVKFPTEGNLKVPSIDYAYTPPFEFRSSDGFAVRPGCAPKGEEKLYARHAMRLRYNGNYNAIKGEEFGGFFPVGITHGLTDTFHALVPPDKYFKSHPEYFSLVDGKRIATSQICLTHPEVVNIVTAGIEKWIQENPQCRIFTIAQNDGFGACQCANCLKVNEENGGHRSGAIIRFMNAVGERIEKKYPHVSLLTDAYLYSQIAPTKEKARKNILVCVTTYGARSATPYVMDKKKTFIKQLEDWKNVCDYRYIYDYDTRFDNYVYPHPNWFVPEQNFRVFRDLGFKGIYRQSGPYQCSEMAQLRAYVSGRLMWNPDLDQKTLMTEFCNGYYGAAGPYVMKYLESIYGEMKSKGGHSYEGIKIAMEFLKQGARLVKNDPVARQHLKVAMISPLTWYLRGQRRANEGKGLVEKKGELVPELKLDPDYRENLNAFKKWTKEFNYGWIGEGGPEAHINLFLNTLPRDKKMKIETISSEAFELQILPDIGGRIYRLNYKPSGRDLISLKRTNVKGKILVNPLKGGFAERPHTFNEFKVVSRKPNSITLETYIEDTSKFKRFHKTVRRTYTLDKKKPILTIETKTTDMRKKDPKQWMKAYLELIADYYVENKDNAITAFYTRTADKGWKRRDVRQTRTGSREIMKFENLPQGAVALEFDGEKANDKFVLLHSYELDKMRCVVWKKNPTDIAISPICHGVHLPTAATHELKQTFEITTREKAGL